MDALRAKIEQKTDAHICGGLRYTKEREGGGEGYGSAVAVVEILRQRNVGRRRRRIERGQRNSSRFVRQQNQPDHEHADLTERTTPMHSHSKFREQVYNLNKPQLYIDAIASSPRNSPNDLRMRIKSSDTARVCMVYVLV